MGDNDVQALKEICNQLDARLDELHSRLTQLLTTQARIDQREEDRARRCTEHNSQLTQLWDLARDLQRTQAIVTTNLEATTKNVAAVAADLAETKKVAGQAVGKGAAAILGAMLGLITTGISAAIGYVIHKGHP